MQPEILGLPRNLWPWLLPIVWKTVLSPENVEDLCIICGVFIHPAAEDDEKIYQYNYEATKIAIKRAINEEPSINEILDKKDSAEHPFYK